MFRPRSEEHPEDESFPGLLLMRLEGRLFFMNMDNVRERVKVLVERERPTVVALDFRAVFDLEYTALKGLTEADEKLREGGVSLWMVGLNPGVLAMVQRSSLGGTLGSDRLLFNLEQAVARYQAMSAGSA